MERKNSGDSEEDASKGKERKHNHTTIKSDEQDKGWHRESNKGRSKNTAMYLNNIWCEFIWSSKRTNDEPSHIILENNLFAGFVMKNYYIFE